MKCQGLFSGINERGGWGGGGGGGGGEGEESEKYQFVVY